MSIVREITKVYEEHLTANAEELISILKDRDLKGEIVFLVSPPGEQNKENVDVEKLLKSAMRTLSLKDAVAEISSSYNLKKKDVYNVALELKND